MMKIWLDDQRPAPEGWVWVRQAREVIWLIKTSVVSEISLDYDLGDDKCGTGEDVLIWLEREMLNGNLRNITINTHSSDEIAKEKMEAKAMRIEDLTVAFMLNRRLR